MDSKLTLHFDKEVIEKAKIFAAENNISLSRLTEFLFRNITSGNYKTLDELPVADWVNMVADGEAEYVRKSAKERKDEFYSSKK